MLLKNKIVSFFNLQEGKSVDELSSEYNLEHKKEAKNHLHNLIIKLIDVNLGPLQFEEFHIKVLRVNEKNNISQSMSFPYFNFKDLVNELWEESEIKDCFNKPFLFFIFKGKSQSNPKFHKLVFWKMPQETIENDVKKVWSFSRDLILNGNIVNYIDKKGRIITNFPSISNTKTVHIRPHGRNASDVDILPSIDKATGLSKLPKYCFWLNKHYIKRTILNGIK